MVVNKESEMKEIWEQTYSLLQEITAQMGNLDESEKRIQDAALNADDKDDPLSLGAFFANNPEVLEQVENGKVPDYFNVENTGDRILDI